MIHHCNIINVPVTLLSCGTFEACERPCSNPLRKFLFRERNGVVGKTKRRRVEVVRGNDKRCGRCKEWFEMNPDNFSRDKSSPGGYAIHCRPCRRVLEAIYRERKKERLKKERDNG